MNDIPLLDRAMLPEERKALFRKIPKRIGLHAAPVGSGPAGETCGSCKHLFRKSLSKTYLKCALVRSHWTGGGGTDIKARDAACSKWEGP
jgi:hypothetical protein